MKIGIDARMYGPTVGGGGIGRYVEELITHLQEIDDTNEYHLFLKKENFHQCVIKKPNFYKSIVDAHWYGLKEQRLVPKAVRQANVDLMHYPHWNVPLLSPKPFVVTIHDLLLLEDRLSARSSTKGTLVHGFKYAAFRTTLENAIHRSSHILTVSNFSKQSILKHFGIKPDKITVTHIGVMPQQQSNTVNLKQLGVVDPYFLYVGNAYPHKNLEMLMHTFAQFCQTDAHTQLVIAGRRDVFSRRLEKEANEIGIPKNRLRFIDLPTDAEIAELYRQTKLFIFPSRIEGFGIPPLEAMVHGTPVAAANTSSLPEILGEAAHYFDPNDIERLQEIMTAAITHPEKMRAFAKKGPQQVQKFSWVKTAKETQKVYNSIKR